MFIVSFTDIQNEYAIFFHENGQGHVVDEYRVESMDLVVDEELASIWR